MICPSDDIHYHTYTATRNTITPLAHFLFSLLISFD